MDIAIRNMVRDDLAAVHAVQCRAHPGCYHESLEALVSRLVLGPEFCLVAEAEGEVGAYFLAHPWAGDPPALHEGLPAILPDITRHLFLHDLAVCPRHRGQAIGNLLYTAMCERALEHGFTELRLVAVGAAQRYWARLGFAALVGHPLHVSYGNAQLMRQMFSPA